jgi:restriction endonuclease
MKLQFKRPKFQADAANAVCDIFKGQRLYDAAYLIDRDVSSAKQNELSYDEANIGIRNHTIEVSDTDILTNLRSIQKQQMLRPDDNEEVADYAAAIYDIVDSIYNPKALLPEDGRKNNVEVSINNEQFARKEFKELWRRINAKSVYTVCFDTAELIQKSIDAINNELSVSQIYFTVTQGTLISINSREVLEISGAFEQAKTGRTKTSVIQADNSVKFDLVGKIVEETGLTRPHGCFDL